MATAAQIEANRRNAQRSTWPKTDEGKSSARCNALRHGMAALTIVPASPQENPKRLEELTQEWDSDVQPQNAIERNLVRQGARLSLAIERGERIETQMLGAWQRTQIRELGRRLLYIAGPEEVKVSRMPHWADDPGLLVSELEESAEGCRWLLERWEEYRNLLDRKSIWNTPVLLRFIRLQGKNVVESIYDPALNSIFLAWDVLVPKYAKEGWHLFQEVKPRTDPAFNHRLVWCEIAPRPSDSAAAWEVLYGVVEQHVGRLKELLARNEASEAAGDPDWAARAALDCSPAFERHRRYQSAKTRELLRTLETLRRMRNAEFGMRNGKAGMAEGACRAADDECQMANDECQMGDDECQVANDECQMAHDECQMAGGELKSPTQNPESPIQNPVSSEDSTNDKMGILTHVGTDAGDGVCQGDGIKQSLDCGVKTLQKAPNEANLESTQRTSSQGVESQNAEPRERERSQFAAGGQVVGGAGEDRVATIVPAGKGGGKARGRKDRSLPEDASAARVCSGRRTGHP